MRAQFAAEMGMCGLEVCGELRAVNVELAHDAGHVILLQMQR